MVTNGFTISRQSGFPLGGKPCWHCAKILFSTLIKELPHHIKHNNGCMTYTNKLNTTWYKTFVLHYFILSNCHWSCDHHHDIIWCHCHHHYSNGKVQVIDTPRDVLSQLKLIMHTERKFSPLKTLGCTVHTYRHTHTHTDKLTYTDTIHIMVHAIHTDRQTH